MLFSELSAAELPEYLKRDVDDLLSLKMNSPEIREIPRINILNDYLDVSIAEIKDKISEYKDDENCWNRLNDLFLSIVDGTEQT